MKKYIPWILLGLVSIASAISLTLITTSNLDLKTNLKNTEVLVSEYKAKLSTAQVAAINQEATLKATIDNLEKSLECNDKIFFKPNYSSNSKMSSALKEYVSEMVAGGVKSATWDVLFKNARLALYNIAVDKDKRMIGYNFLVYFDEENFKASVFSVNYQCWLDR